MFKKAIFGLVLLFSSLIADVSLGVIGNHGYIEFDTVEEFNQDQGKNWVAIYKKGDSTDWGNVLRWSWIKDLSSHGDKTYDFEFDDLESGKVYELRFFYDNSYDIAKSVDFTFSGSKPFLQIEKYDTDTLNLISSNIDLNSNSWVGIYEKGKSHDWDNVIGWNWVDSTTANDKDYRSTIEGLNLVDGVYDVRLFYNNSFDLEASVELVVDNAHGDIPKIFDAVSKSGDKIIKVRFENALGNEKDWIGVFEKGAERNSDNVLGWAYLGGKKSGQVDVEVDTLYVGVGKYDLVMFSDDSYDVIGEGELDIKTRIIGSFINDDASIVNMKISTDGTKAYSIYHHNGIYIFDVSKPDKVKLISHLTAGNSPYDIEISQDEKIAYTIDASSDLLVQDISDPYNLKRIGQLRFPGSPRDLILSKDNKLIYMLTTGLGLKLQIVDISDPRKPRFIPNYEYLGAKYNIVTSEDGTKLYFTIDKNEIHILDITTQREPKFISAIPPLNNKPCTFKVSTDGTKIYRLTLDTLEIIDINNPFKPEVISNIEFRNKKNSITLSKDNKIAYIGGLEGTLDILDISNPLKPKIKTSLADGAGSSKNVLSPDGTRLYLLRTPSKNAFKILDLIGID